MLTSIRPRVVLGAMAAAAVLSAAGSAMAVGGSLSTATGGVVGGGQYTQANGGFLITYDATQLFNSAWRYTYTISRANGNNLGPAGSHIIIEVSRNATLDDIFNISGPTESVEFGEFGPGSGNPGFPVGESIYGIKINYDSDVSPQTISFDSFRAPRWSDFYGKGGSTSFAYNTSLGIAAVNDEDFLGTPMDALGNSLFKILAPDTVPTPGAAALLGLGMLAATRRRR